MDAIQQIRFEAGGTLRFDPPQDGRPTSATFSLYKPDGTLIGTANRAATLDSVNTTLTGAASEGDTGITLADASDVEVGRSYLLTASSDGESEWIRVLARNTSTGAVELAEPLRQDYGSGDPCTGNRITCSVSSSDAGTLDEGYECRITYVVSGSTYVTSLYYDVVRQPWSYTILRADEFRRHVGSLAADALERIDAAGLAFTDEIATATELVRQDIIDRGLRPDLFRSHEAFKRPIALRVIYEWACDGVNIPASYGDSPEIWRDQQEQRYERALSQALKATKTYDADDSGTVSTSERTHNLASIRIEL